MCLALQQAPKTPVEAKASFSVPQFTNPFSDNSPIPPQHTSRLSFDDSRRSRRSGGIFNRIHSGIQKLSVSPRMFTKEDLSDSMMDNDLWLDGSRKMSIWSEDSNSSQDSSATFDSMTTMNDDDEDNDSKSQFLDWSQASAEEFSYEEAYDAVRGLVTSSPKSNLFHEISAWSANTSEAEADDSSLYSLDSMTASDDEEEWSPSALHLSGDSFVYNRSIREVELRGFLDKVEGLGELESPKVRAFTRRAFRDTFGSNMI